MTAPAHPGTLPTPSFHPSPTRGSRTGTLSRTYEPLIAQAKGDERRKVRQEYSDQLWEIEHERRKDGDFKLIRKAHRYDIPIPRRREEDGFWEEVGTGYWQLTEKGTHHC